MRCRRLIRAVGRALGRSLPVYLHERLCLSSPCVERVEEMVVMFTTYHTTRERNWVSPDALNSAARAAVRTLRMASPTDQIEKKWQPPQSIIPTPRTFTDDSSTSSDDDPVVVHAVSAA
eukprot:2527176-Pyramimonas_sp.AAC.1